MVSRRTSRRDTSVLRFTRDQRSEIRDQKYRGTTSNKPLRIFWGDPIVSGITAALRATGFAERKMQTRNRLTFVALCVIARTVIEQERSIDDAEWKERIKCRIAREGRAYPTPLELSAALAAVEQVLVKRWGPRPCLHSLSSRC
jgi:hypothetical protein